METAWLMECSSLLSCFSSWEKLVEWKLRVALEVFRLPFLFCFSSWEKLVEWKLEVDGFDTESFSGFSSWEKLVEWKQLQSPLGGVFGSSRFLLLGEIS